MKNLEQQFSENLSITASSNSVRGYSDSIPVDLLIDIFSSLPANSIARFRCVSKLWESILGRQDFKDIFLTKSLTRPRFLFTFKVKDELVVFSAPQPQNPEDNSCLVATPYKYFPKHVPTDVYTYLCGLVFLRSWGRKSRAIYNPATGESITLPQVKATGVQESYIGFDPIKKQFKVLCLTWSRYGPPNTHRILTLETGKRLWRTIKHPPFPHLPLYDKGICINGVLYYRDSLGGYFKIVCFDFRVEKFSLIELDREMLYEPYLTFFNYKGKIGAHRHYSLWGKRGLDELWVLEDAGKHKWSKLICQLPPLWNRTYQKIVGMTGSGEIVLSSYPYGHHLSKPFYIFYYNIERNTLTRVNIQGFEEFKHHQVFLDISLDFVENMNI